MRQLDKKTVDTQFQRDQATSITAFLVVPFGQRSEAATIALFTVSSLFRRRDQTNERASGRAKERLRVSNGEGTSEKGVGRNSLFFSLARNYFVSFACNMLDYNANEKS